MIYTVTLYSTGCGTEITQWYLSSNFEAKAAENALYSTAWCLSVGIQFAVLWNEVTERNVSNEIISLTHMLGIKFFFLA